MSDVTLFVYGTLRRGGVSEGRMHAATWLGPAVTAPRYEMVRIAWYPGLRAGTTSITGDLYSVPVSALPALDTFEGPEYSRGTVQLADGTNASAYMLRPEFDRGYPAVPSGDWLQEA